MFLSEIVAGNPVRVWSEHDLVDLSPSCGYSKDKLVRGDPGTCPAAESLLVRSMPAGCVRRVREAIAKSGLGQPHPTGCNYD